MLKSLVGKTRQYVVGGNLRNDLIAGIVTGSVLVPQSMSYALLANLPPQYGVYSTVSLVVYALLGTSPLLSVAPVAMSSLLVGGYTAQLETVEEIIQASSVIAFYCGLFQVIFALTRLGTFFSTWLSKTMLMGFGTGVALTIIISQLPSAFGVSVPQSAFPIYNFGIFLTKLPDTKPIAFGFFIISFILLYTSQRFLKPRMRANIRFVADLILLIVIVVSTAVSFAIIEYAGVQPKTQLPIVGSIPAGFPEPKPPMLETMSDGGLVGTAVAISIVAFSEGFSVASNLQSSAETEHKIDANREFFAVGMCNIVSSMFNGYVVSGGMGRTMVNVKSGAVTQVSGLVAFVVALLAIFFVAPAIQYIPKSLLAAVILTAVLGMIKTVGLAQTFYISKRDFVMATSTALMVVGIGPMYGIAYGLVVSIAVTMQQIAIPHIAELGQMRGMLRNLKRYPEEAKRIPGVVVVRVDSPLFFANAPLFFTKCKQLIHTSTEDEENAEVVRTRAFLVDASGIGFIDSSSLHDLLKFQQFLAKKDIHLVLAEVRGPVRDTIQRFNKATNQKLTPFYERLPQDDEVVGIDGIDGSNEATAASINELLTCFSVHSLDEALVEIRLHHLAPNNTILNTV